MKNCSTTKSICQATSAERYAAVRISKGVHESVSSAEQVHTQAVNTQQNQQGDNICGNNMTVNKTTISAGETATNCGNVTNIFVINVGAEQLDMVLKKLGINPKQVRVLT